ncbi:U-box domain containing protein [Rhynchospora pubera]|uniref:U-box domain-containing protein n=1 Tax=Rhynchospora pubera TaxID=906938 RepID=A0AAV8HFV9_9POAL|nr:U-box domain containing protein [Rhynchospora pubera]
MRKEERLRSPPPPPPTTTTAALEVKIPVPSFFRCPISLDVMRSPVSLCTGVTYDRASIQRWLDSGNTTCPATMQPLPSTDLVPNLTLQRLIRLWCSESAVDPAAVPGSKLSARRLAGRLVKEISASSDPAAPLRRLAGFFSDDDVDEFEKNDLINAGGCISAVQSAMKRKCDDVETLEASSGVLALVLRSESIEEANKKTVVTEFSSDLATLVSCLVKVLSEGTCLESRIDAARILQSVLAASNSDSRSLISEEPGLILELIRLIGPVDEKGTIERSAVRLGVACLAGICSVRKVRGEMVQLGVVSAVTRVLITESDMAVSECALKIMEAVAGCAEGRMAMCENGAMAVKAVACKMMKAGKCGAEAAVAALWAVCIKCKDRRAVEALAGVEGGLTRLLLLMQSGCSPVARQMAGDLIKIFKVNAKNCLAGYESKTTHIMPF